MSAPITAEAGANIAFIKYWGNRGPGLNLPLNASISMTLASCVTRTQVELRPGLSEDEVLLDGRAVEGRARARIVGFLDIVRRAAAKRAPMRVVSQNSFPSGCGIASSASGFAALALAASAACGLRLDGPDPPGGTLLQEAPLRSLSRLARLGSGSAARSVLGGFVELRPGATHEEAFAEQRAPETAWDDLRDLVVVVSAREKAVPSADGHGLARTSEMLPARLAAVPERAKRVRDAIAARDLTRLGEAAEEDALSMHAVMMTSRPSLVYWMPGTLEVMQAVRELRRRGVEAYFTIDAGPNVHVLTLEKHLAAVCDAMTLQFGCRTIADRAGPGVRLIGV